MNWKRFKRKQIDGWHMARGESPSCVSSDGVASSRIEEHGSGPQLIVEDEHNWGNVPLGCVVEMMRRLGYEVKEPGA